MTAFRRQLTNGFAVLSLALCAALAAMCVAIVAAWVGSYYAYVHVANGSLSRPTAVVGRSFEGKLYFERRSYWVYQRGWTVDRRRIRPGQGIAAWYPTLSSALSSWYATPSTAHRFLGFGMYSGTQYSWPEYLYPGVPMPSSQADPRFWRDKYVALAVPYWAVMAIFIVLTLWLNAKRPRFEWRRKIGFCSSCGYDLRATPDRCPECGTIPAKTN
jgi:hypothetical protein